MIASNIGATASSIQVAAPVATPLLYYQVDGFTISTNNLTSTKGGASAVARKVSDATTSTLALRTFEVGWDTSWSGEIAFGLGTPNYAGAGFNAMEFAIYCPASRALQGKVTTGGTASALGYTIPAASTSKLRVRAVADTTFWMVYFERSIDSGATWTVINTGGTLSAIAKTTPVYGLVLAFSTATIFKDIKGDA